MKATGHDFFVDGTVSANVKAEEFEFHPGKPRLVIFPPAIQTTTERRYTIFVPSIVPAVLPEQSVVPATRTTTTAPDSTTTEPPCNTAGLAKISETFEDNLAKLCFILRPHQHKTIGMFDNHTSNITMQKTKYRIAKFV